MGNYTNTDLGRDRAFDTADMEELLTQGKGILNHAITISRKMETAITAISGIYGGIDAEYRHGALGSDISALSGTLEKDVYQDTMDRLDKILGKLMRDIPAYDTALAGDMDGIKETLDSIKGRLSELEGLLETGDINLGYREFCQRLEDIKAGWDETTEDLAEFLAGLENDMLGVSVAAVQYSADPVNLSTGNFVYDHEDLKIGGEIPLSFHRYYNAKDRVKGSMGRCFVHNYESRLEEDTEKGKVTVSMGDGQKKTFRKAKDGTYRGLHSAMETLEKEGNGYILTKPTGERTVYNEAGQPVRQENRHGRGITFSHSADGKLEKVETDNGASLSYSYNEAGQLILVTDHTGRNIELSYEKGKLSAVKTPQGSVYAYHYGKNGRIEENVNPRGYTTVKNTYDKKRRITRQEFPDGSRMEYAYDDSKRQVILTERNGSRTTYVHDSKYRCTDILYEDGTKEHFGYNGKNQRILHVDRNGNTTRMAYDNKGNLTQVINALGEKTNLTYNADNQLAVLKVNGKEKLRNSYDKQGNLVSSTGADGNGNRTSYDESGRPVRIENPDKSTVEITYDAAGNITNIRDACGADTGYEYDSLNRVTRTTDGNGNVTVYEYDSADRVAKVTTPLGTQRSYCYNESGKVTRVTDYDGYTVEAAYNEIGKICRITDKEGNATEFSYDSMWNTAGITQADGGTVRYTYDGNNRLCAESLPDAGTTSYTYDGNGNRTGVTDAEGNHTAYAYDALNRIIRVTDASGAETSYTYDAEGNLVSVTDALGNRTVYAYDGMKRCISETDALGNTTAYAYDTMGNVESIRYPDGTAQIRSYRNGRLSEIRKADGSRMQYTYDGNGNCTCMENGTGEKLTITYDALNRRKAITNPDGGTRRFEYDAVGNITEMTDENGNMTRYAYTPNGNLASVTDALGNETRYSYDAMGHLTGAIRAGDTPEDTQTTLYGWNQRGLVTSITDPLGAEETFGYDKNGRLTEKRDRDGYQTSYTYDCRDLLTGILYGDGTEVSYSYDALRRLQEAKDSTGTTRIMTDALGRVTAVTDPAGKTTGYEWGSTGGRLRLAYPDGKEACYRYNEKGQLAALETAGGITGYAYDETGRLREKTYPDGTRTEYTYTAAGQPERIRHTGTGFLEEYSYRYDMAGNKTEARKVRSGMDADSGIFGYGYDALNRLTEVRHDGALLRKYAYDAFGNRTVKEDYGGQEPVMTTYRYNAAGQLVSLADADGEQTYSYDGRGNLTAVSRGEELLRSFTFDAANRMQGAFSVRDGVERRAEYTYDAFGNRRGQKVYGSGHMAEPQDPEQNIRYTIDLTRQYHNLLQKEDADAIQTFYWDWNAAAMEEDGTYSSYLQDDLGSPMHLLDENGEIRESYGFDEFGMPLEGFPEQPLQPFGFTGYQAEEAGGLYFAQARRYDADAGRFVSEDRIKGNAFLPATINAYLYCRNQPLKYTDPSGNDCYYFYLPEWENEALNDQGQLADFYGLDEAEVHLVEITDNQSLTDGWNGMGTENGVAVDIDAVVINTHGSPTSLSYGSNSEERMTGSDIQGLDNKDVGALVLYGCNAGHADYVGENPASEFSRKVNGAPVMASDGTVYPCLTFFNLTKRQFWSFISTRFWRHVPDGVIRRNYGWLIYQYENDSVSVSEGLGTAMHLTAMLEELDSCACPE